MEGEETVVAPAEEAVEVTEAPVEVTAHANVCDPADATTCDSCQ